MKLLKLILCLMMFFLAQGASAQNSMENYDPKTITSQDVQKLLMSRRGREKVQTFQSELAGRVLTFMGGYTEVGLCASNEVIMVFRKPGSMLEQRDSFRVRCRFSDPQMLKLATIQGEHSRMKKVTGKVAILDRWDSVGAAISGELVLEDVKVEPYAMPLRKGDLATMTGDRLVQQNAVLLFGLSSERKKKLHALLQGKELTFHQGVIRNIREDVSRKLVYVDVKFTVTNLVGGAGETSFSVECLVSDPEQMQLVRAMDEGAAIKSLVGKVSTKPSKNSSFELTDGKIVPLVRPSLEKEYDPKKVTGIELIKLHESKPKGLSLWQMRQMQADLGGRTLTFPGGNLVDAFRRDGTNFMGVIYGPMPTHLASKAPFVVVCLMKDQDKTLQLLERMDCKAGIKSLTGRVVKPFTEDAPALVLDNIVLIPEIEPAQSPYVPAKVTGDEIQALCHPSGTRCSTLKMGKIFTDVIGRELTFSNGTAYESKRDDKTGDVVLSVRFGPEGNYEEWTYIKARVSDAELKELASGASYAKKIKLKSLTGRVSKESGIVKGPNECDVVLENAKFVLAD